MDIYKPHVFDFENETQFYSNLEAYLVDKILEVNAEFGVVRIALSGGSTPLPLYKLFSTNLALPADKLEIFQTDERYVDKNSDDSNQNNIRKSFDDDFINEVGQLNFINTALPIDQAVKDYNENLDTLEGSFFDLIILGVGADGHIASLFPNGEYLKHQDNSVIATIAPSQFSSAKRITLTLEAILSSKEIALLIKGPNKEYILQEILEGTKSAKEFPVKFLLAHPNVRIYNCFENNNESS